MKRRRPAANATGPLATGLRPRARQRVAMDADAGPGLLRRNDSGHRTAAPGGVSGLLRCNATGQRAARPGGISGLLRRKRRRPAGGRSRGASRSFFDENASGQRTARPAGGSGLLRRKRQRPADGRSRSRLGAASMKTPAASGRPVPQAARGCFDENASGQRTARPAGGSGLLRRKRQRPADERSRSRLGAASMKTPAASGRPVPEAARGCFDENASGQRTARPGGVSGRLRRKRHRQRTDRPGGISGLLRRNASGQRTDRPGGVSGLLRRKHQRPADGRSWRLVLLRCNAGGRLAGRDDWSRHRSRWRAIERNQWPLCGRRA